MNRATIPHDTPPADVQHESTTDRQTTGQTEQSTTEQSTYPKRLPAPFYYDLTRLIVCYNCGQCAGEYAAAPSLLYIACKHCRAFGLLMKYAKDWRAAE
jgi:DNA-directed RNA polymerase subunit RPC12/RpoP